MARRKPEDSSVLVCRTTNQNPTHDVSSCDDCSASIYVPIGTDLEKTVLRCESCDAKDRAAA